MMDLSYSWIVVDDGVVVSEPEWKEVSHPLTFMAKIIGTRELSEEKRMECALMVSAAPDMLKVLKRLQRIYSDYSADTFDLNEIRSILNAAIEKAEGH